MNRALSGIRFVADLIRRFGTRHAKPAEPVGASKQPCVALLLRTGLVMTAVAFSAPAHAKITRHCDAKIQWQTTGGSLSGSFGKKMGTLFRDRAFSAPGTCGNRQGNKCRERARDTMRRCLAAHRDALKANPNATRPPECHSVKHYDYRWGHIGPNDVLKRVAAEVCCRGPMRTFNFSNESDVRINLRAKISGSNSRCNAEVSLYDNLRINCSVARQQCPDIKE